MAGGEKRRGEGGRGGREGLPATLCSPLTLSQPDQALQQSDCGSGSISEVRLPLQLVVVRENTGGGGGGGGGGVRGEGRGRWGRER